MMLTATNPPGHRHPENNATASPGDEPVDATGSRRRIQALIALGWPWSTLSAALGLSWSLRQLAGIGQVSRELQLRITQLYDRLSMTVPETYVPSGKAAQARACARRRHWAPPLAWDDEAIDDPCAVPADWTQGIARDLDEYIDEIAVLRRAQGDKEVPVTPREAAEVVRLCRTWQLTDRQIEKRTGIRATRHLVALSLAPSQPTSQKNAA